MAVTVFFLWSDSRALYSAITGVWQSSNFGVTPVRLLDTTDTMCSKSPCHQPFSVSEQRLDTQDNFFVKPAGPDCLRSVGAALGRRVQSQCSLLFFSQASGRGERVPGSPHASTRRWSQSRGGHAPVTPLWDGGPRISPTERTVSTARKFPRHKNTITSESVVCACTHAP